jgi:hypothetical protein
MEVKFNKYVYFRSLIKKLQSKGTKDNILSSVNEKIASASRRFIKAGKVTPALAPATEISIDKAMVLNKENLLLGMLMKMKKEKLLEMLRMNYVHYLNKI